MKSLVTLLLVLALAACAREENTPYEPSTTNTTGTSVPGAAEDTSATTMTAAATDTTPGATATSPTDTNPEPPADTAKAPASTIADGQSIFREKCVACHGADGKTPAAGATIATAATQQKADAELIRTLREGSDAHRRLTLTEEQARAVVAYVKALK